nr:uncharacterized protein LOC117857153 [Setaria viridis]
MASLAKHVAGLPCPPLSGASRSHRRPAAPRRPPSALVCGTYALTKEERERERMRQQFDEASERCAPRPWRASPSPPRTSTLPWSPPTSTPRSAPLDQSFIFHKLVTRKMVVCAEPPPKLKIPESITELTDDDNHESSKPERRTRMHHIERHRSCVVTLSDMELNDLQPRRLLQTLEVSKSPEGGLQCSLHEENPYRC